jgi:hypothetical protein
MLIEGSGTNEEAKIIKNSSDGFRVANFVAANHLFDFTVRESFAGNSLVFLWFGFAESQIFGEKNVHPLFEKTGCGENVEEDVEALGAVAGFFNQFAGSGTAGIFAFVDSAGDEFPEELPSGVAILSNHDNSSIRQCGEDDDRAGVRDEFACDAQAAGLDNFVAAKSEDRTLVNHFAAEDFGGGAAGCFGRHRAYVFSGDIIHCRGTIYRAPTDKLR